MARPSSNPNPDDLPVPATEDRPYLKIQPTATPLDPQQVAAQARNLHGLDTGADEGVLSRLRGSPRPTIEFLLITDHTASIEYYVGIDPPEALDALRSILRRAFPPSYEVTRTNWHPDHLPTAGEHVATVEYLGDPDRTKDCYTQLTPFAEFTTSEQATVPLATVAEAMAASDVPMVYQALIEPLADQTADAQLREREIEAGTDTLGGQLVEVVFGPPDEELDLTAAEEQRLEELHEKELRHAFAVNARVMACADSEPQATHAVRPCTSAFGDVSHTCYTVTGTLGTDEGLADNPVYQRLQDRQLVGVNEDGLPAWLPGTTTRSRGILADPTEVGNFCFLAGDAVTPDAKRALGTVPESQTSVPRPPAAQLEPFQQPGQALGYPRTHDGALTEPVAIPPALQPLHSILIGGTGSGKTTSVINMSLANFHATSGPEIIIDPKGGSMPTEYLRSYYERYGTLENVLYFDCAEWLPALSFFDIHAELEAGVPRAVAVEDRVGHYQEVLAQHIGQEQYERALRSTDIIENVLRALYDPVHGNDVLSNRELHAALRRLHDRETPPAVGDSDLEERLDSMVSNVNSRTFNDIMHGALNRVEKLSTPTHLNEIFNHRPSGIHADQSMFDFADWLDEDVVIIFDTGRLRPGVKQGLTLTLLSNLWTALRRRRRRNPEADLPLVNVYLEEAASVAPSQLLQRLLSQGRAFGCALTLAMQFPGQVAEADKEVYRELLNNVGTYVTSSVGVDHDLAHRFATEVMGKETMANRLRGLSRGEWLVNLPGEFGGRSPQPFVVESLPLPDGHPESTAPRPTGYDDAYEAMCTRTRTDYGLSIADEPGTEPNHAETGRDATPDATTADESDGTSESSGPPTVFDWTTRMPTPVTYDDQTETLLCLTCNSRHDPSVAGMQQAIECCHSLDEVDRDNVPICGCTLKLGPAEVAASEWSRRQLCFLQAVCNAHQQRYDPIEYDIVRDSMIRLKEYLDVDETAIDELLDADLLRHDGDHPHRLYTVTAAGRDVIAEHQRQGVEYGHAKGDLGESSQHVFMVELVRRWLVQKYAEDSDSDVEEVVPYYELRQGSVDTAAFMGSEEDVEEATQDYEHHRLDLVGLDADGEIVVTVEAERINNDVNRAVPEDYDKMAACDPNEAIWVVMTRGDGHTVLETLNDPPAEEPRVEKTYSENTPPRQFNIDEPGLTAVYPVKYISQQLDEEE
ncbi:type IV secretory system conjugative DNA transfer family protein [Halorientalis brevis]|uniref:Type IV secretory system conjugative DNA transfer family protein n=1 Tax=Halorientalis brevis TaxID=1126241 RepID=A0ABD6CCY1_9EURY|nr:hypothetical protein [Halorientalis brevis]